jgi:hypothetical protein
MVKFMLRSVALNDRRSKPRCLIGWFDRAIFFGNGLVPLVFRTVNSFMRPFAQMPRYFCRLTTNGDDAGYNSRVWMPHLMQTVFRRVSERVIRCSLVSDLYPNSAVLRSSAVAHTFNGLRDAVRGICAKITISSRCRGRIVRTRQARNLRDVTFMIRQRNATDHSSLLHR